MRSSKRSLEQGATSAGNAVRWRSIRPPVTGLSPNPTAGGTWGLTLILNQRQRSALLRPGATLDFFEVLQQTTQAYEKTLERLRYSGPLEREKRYAAADYRSIKKKSYSKALQRSTPAREKGSSAVLQRSAIARNDGSSKVLQRFAAVRKKRSSKALQRFAGVRKACCKLMLAVSWRWGCHKLTLEARQLTLDAHELTLGLSQADAGSCQADAGGCQAHAGAVKAHAGWT